MASLDFPLAWTTVLCNIDCLPPNGLRAQLLILPVNHNIKMELAPDERACFIYVSS